MKIIISLEDFEKIIFKRRIINESGCWLWTGCLVKNEYGVIQIKGRQYRVHRLSLHVYKGLDYNDPILKALHILECKNKHCFNPSHLYIGTIEDNANDTVILKIHRNSKKTHCKNGHMFNRFNTYIKPNGIRQCRECHRLEEEKRRNAKAATHS